MTMIILTLEVIDVMVMLMLIIIVELIQGLPGTIGVSGTFLGGEGLTQVRV